MLTCTKPFVVTPSRPLPTGFPNDVPIYKGQRSETVVTDTYFERASGATQYVISFLTKDNQDQVIGFYRGEFQRKGWTVRDPTQGNQGNRGTSSNAFFDDADPTRHEFDDGEDESTSPRSIVL